MEKKWGLPALAKKGEGSCGDELVIFFEDKNHKNCISSTVWTFSIVILFYKRLREMIGQFLYNKLYIVVIVSLDFSPNKKINPIHWFFFMFMVKLKLLLSMCN